MLHKMLKILLILSFTMLLTSCWSNRELNELAIASALGIDKAGDQYRVSLQIVNPSEVASKSGGAGYQTPVTVYTVYANTILEAVRKAATVAPRKIYLAQLRTIVIGEELARSGISLSLDYLMREREVREEGLYILIAKGGKAEDTLKVLTHLDKIPATKMANALQTLERYWAPTNTVQLSEVLYDLISGAKYSSIPGIVVKGVKDGGKTTKNVQTLASPTYLQFEETAVFKKDKLIGWLDEEESKGYNYITDRVIKTVGHFRCPDGGKVAMDVIRTKTNLKARMVEGKPKIELKLWMEGNIADLQCRLNPGNPTAVAELQKIGEKNLERLIRKALQKVQHELKSDALGFGEAVHRSYSSEWKTLKDRWDDIFPDVPVHLDINLRIRNTGTMNQSMLERAKG